jgi:hypothetical protein
MNDIDALLREAARAEVPDNGFSERVLQALPRRAPRHEGSWRPLLVMGSALLGSALAVLLAPGEVLAGFAQLAQAHFQSPAALAALALPAALLVSAVVVAFDAD